VLKTAGKWTRGSPCTRSACARARVPARAHARVEGRGEKARGEQRRGTAVQVAPIKPALKAPGTMRLKLKYGKLISIRAFESNLRRYTAAAGSSA